MYTFRNRCLEDDSVELGDQTTKLFLNSKGHSDTLDTDIATFLRYVDGHTPEGQFVSEINQEVVRVKKHDETRREYMTFAMEMKRLQTKSHEEGREEGREEGIKEGVIKGIYLTAQNMLNDGMSMELVSRYTHLPMDDIHKLAEQQNRS